ncbi:small heat shock protein (HSP20) family protein [Pleurotus pulmonarius]
MSSVFYYEPFTDFDRLFEEAFNARTGSNNQNNAQLQRSSRASNVIHPKMDLHEDAKANSVVASFELPGFKKEDVHIDVHNGRLTVSADSNVSSEKKEEGYVVKERRFGKYSRTLQLPQGIKDEEVKAAMEDGVLTVTFPKSAPEMAPKKITIS